MIRTNRVFEIIPGLVSWLIIAVILIAFAVKPFAVAVFLIIYLLYWVMRLLYMSSLLVMAHYRMLSHRQTNWLDLCRGCDANGLYERIVHVVLYTVYKEPDRVIDDSLGALLEINYPRDKMIIVLAGEEREDGSAGRLEALKLKYAGSFRDILVTIHPEGIKNDALCKGANATYAAKEIKKYLQAKSIDFSNVVISCFDADTCVDKAYFACLTYHFLSNPKRFQTSFQPLPIYSNNIFRAPAFARVIEMGSTFWQLIESMRSEKFITFSSHSMSFKTLVDVNYWPTNLISDDSLIFWRCFLKFNGDYMTYPLEVPVYMDIAVGRNMLDTFLIQYRQKRRWAWGVENFVFLGTEFMNNTTIPLSVKLRKMGQLLDNHVNWATWAIIISFITPLVLFWGGCILKDSLVLLNLSYINGVIFNSLFVIILICMFISKEFISPRPKDVSRLIYVSFVLQWLFVPFVSALLGSFPALDAQTRLMLGKYLQFQPTPKNREEQ